MSRLTASAASPVVERLMRAHQRSFDIEYKTLFSNHTVWLVVPSLRVGLSEAEVQKQLEEYSAKLEPANVAAAAPAYTGKELEGLTNMKRDGYGSMLAFFDAEIAAALAEQGGTDDAHVAAALDAVCARHLPRVARGCIGAAFHPILELSAGLEGLSPAVAASGLAYLHARSWKELDTHPITLQGDGPADLVSVLQAWCAATLAPEGQRQLQHAWDTISQVEIDIGAFQKRMLRCLQHLDVYTAHPVVLPKEAPADNTPDALCRHYGLDDAFVLAASALTASGNEFFVLHGLTSLWAVRQTIRRVPSLTHEVRCELVSSWLRGYFAAFAAQALPGIHQLLPAVGLLQARDMAGLAEQFGKVPAAEGEASWEGVISACSRMWREEHILKAAWMLQETQAELPAEVHPVLFGAAYRVATYVPPDVGSATYFPEDNTLRFATDFTTKA